MKVSVNYAAQAREAAGVAGETVELSGGGSMGDLLRCLVERRGERFRDLVLDGGGRPRPFILAFVGDEQVRWDSARALREGDVVSILSPISGG